MSDATDNRFYREKQERPSSKELYYLQARGHTGNSLLWWRDGRHGYTNDIGKAHVFTKEEAFAQHRCRPDTDFPWRKNYIDSRTQRHVVVDDIGHEEEASFAPSPEPCAIQFNEHDAEIIKDLEAMAANQLAGFWPQALAIGALRLIKRSTQPPCAHPWAKLGIDGDGQFFCACGAQLEKSPPWMTVDAMPGRVQPPDAGQLEQLESFKQMIFAGCTNELYCGPHPHDLWETIVAAQTKCPEQVKS